MLSILTALLVTACDVLRPRADLLLEVAALRQQLGVLRRHIAFIRRISSETPGWGEDRIALEMEPKLGGLAHDYELAA